MIRTLKRWWRAQKARRMHAFLVAEARADWRVVKTYRLPCLWNSTPCGYMVIKAMENMLGERRVEVVSRPAPPWNQVRDPSSELWAKLKQWEAEGQRKAIPYKEIA